MGDHWMILLPILWACFSGYLYAAQDNGEPVLGRSAIFPKCWPATTFNAVNDTFYGGGTGFPQTQAHSKCAKVCRESYGETFYGVRRIDANAQCWCENALNVSSVNGICNSVCAGYPCGGNDSTTEFITVYPVCDYGMMLRDCSKNCPGFCNNEGVCQVDSGECKDGCSDGYYTDDCSMPCGACTNRRCHQRGPNAGVCQDGCQMGYHGGKCDMECSVNCIKQFCERYTENCIYGCEKGTFGQKCDQSCPQNCNNGECNQTSGDCSQGCSAGWWYGAKCDQLCSHNCTDPYCNTTFVDGICDSCNQGWYGSQCDRTCPSNCYQQRCNFQLGTCGSGCTTGFYGETCDQSCSRTCVDNVCKIDGECEFGCQAGWKGQNCTADENECDGEGAGNQCQSRGQVCHNIPGSHQCCQKNEVVSSETLQCTKKDKKLPTGAIAAISVLSVISAGTIIAVIVLSVKLSKTHSHHRPKNNSIASLDQIPSKR